MQKNTTRLLIILFTILSLHSKSQDSIVLDKIVAVIGGTVVKLSEIQNQYYQMQLEGLTVDEKVRCSIIEETLYSKLLLNQAKLDSLNVSESQIDEEMNRRISMLSEQIGSEQKLEAFYGKKIDDIKVDWRQLVEEQLLTRQMQGKIVQDVAVSPNEVSKYFKNLPEDSLPEINPQYEMALMVVKPPVTHKQKIEIKQQIEGLRERALRGESFSKLAVMYSEDLSSAKKGGELGFVSRADLVPEFAGVAFKLREGEISRVVETEYGYHIIEMIEKKGEKVNVRHILISPKVSKENIAKGKQRIDSLYTVLKKDSISFGELAQLCSEDEQTKNNNGLYVNPYTGTSKFEAKQVDPFVFSYLKELQVGAYSEPFMTQDETGKQVFKIVKLISKTDAHKATMLGDYQIIKEMALDEKKRKIIGEWITNKCKEIYIKLSPDITNCDFEHKSWLKN